MIYLAWKCVGLAWGCTFVLVYLAATASALTVNIAWDYDSANGQDGFELLRCTGTSCTPSTPLSLSIGPAVRQIGDTGVSGGTSYCYTVRATLSGSGPFPASNTLCVTVPAPAVADHLAFNPGPSGTIYANTVMAPVIVEVRDFYNAVVTSSTASITVSLAAATPQDIPQAGVTLVSVDSQETVGETAPGTRAIDGNTTTFWHTQWFNAAPPHPHTIIVDLGQSYRVTGLKYLPRQGNQNGMIGQFDFSVSPDGQAWGPVVDSGTFTPADFTQKTRAFMAKNGRYVRLIAYSEVNGNPWTTVAELTVVQTPGLGAGVLQGGCTSAQNAVAGKRTCSDLVVTQAGQYNLLASSPGLFDATQLFQVQDQPTPTGVPRVVRFGR